MEGRGVRRTRDEMEGEAVAPVVQAEARDQVTAATDAAVRPVAVRHDIMARASGRWTLDSSVEDVLMERYGGLDGMRLHDFLLEHFGETFGCPSVSMRAFIGNPSFFLRDESMLELVTNSSPYREYRTMREGVDRLSAREIFSLLQWEGAVTANEVEDINACVRGKLNAALLSARRNEEAMRNANAPSDEEIDGVYDSVFNARWSYVVMSDEYGEGTLGMGVLDVGEGEQPHLWSEAQADAPYDPEEPWEGDVVPGVEGKLVMAVLSSQKGWPYMLFDADEVQKRRVDSLTEYNAVCDAYIRKENLRVWHIVKNNIDKWNSGVEDVHPFVVIGTPGIGKSFATGSLLLYQLLHYLPERLKVVAYFVSGKAYIFHREGRRVVYYAYEETAINEIEEMASKGVKGYMIYDISGKIVDVRVGSCSSTWGIVLITSPDVKKYHEFTKQLHRTLPIYINCFEDAEFKAALVWERQSQLTKKPKRLEQVNLANDWKVLKKRIDMIGPLPRYVLWSKAMYEHRLRGVKNALELLPSDDFEYYMGVLDNPHKWYEDGTTHKLVKLVRCEANDEFECRNRVTSIYVRKEIYRKMLVASIKASQLRDILSSALEKCADLFEIAGLRAFIDKTTVDTLVRHLKYLPRNKERKRESVLCQWDANGRVPTTLSEFASDGPKRELKTGCLYKPLIPNFPLVDGFFVVEGKGPKTIVLLQITKAKEHHTKRTTVREFRDYMRKVFKDWGRIEESCSWELIYIQHVDSTAIKKRQNCSTSGGAANDTDLALWDRIHQYQVTLNTNIAAEPIDRGTGLLKVSTTSGR
ncbi:unnamed protein product [Trypanosoma congolense IL3000]|uniref:WGS project CAEQ00000000 data, annotated contig 447 n=1 Tax=Trypanosoma congolense (strain IL3000) TaxID=1068625 RepID=F9WG05_TRYCI|nr:unnamed protein product [Trypanosoma congolense IL3000]